MRNAILTALLVMAGCAAPSGGEASDRACDEAGIRRWFADWMKATREGDLGLARRLIADDAVFLVPGAGRMDKETFAAAGAYVMGRRMFEGGEIPWGDDPPFRAPQRR